MLGPNPSQTPECRAPADCFTLRATSPRQPLLNLGQCEPVAPLRVSSGHHTPSLSNSCQVRNEDGERVSSAEDASGLPVEGSGLQSSWRCLGVHHGNCQPFQPPTPAPGGNATFREGDRPRAV
jgi:hypothetical protein